MLTYFKDFIIFLGKCITTIKSYRQLYLLLFSTCLIHLQFFEVSLIRYFNLKLIILSNN